MNVAALVMVAAGAVLAPLIVELTPGVALPVVVVELALGIIAGPVLGIVEPGPLLHGLAGFGMAFLFFLAGMEIDLKQISGRPLLLGAGGWAVSLLLAFAVAGTLAGVGLDIPIEFVAAALCTTALGTLLPILRDAGGLPSRLGRHAVAAGVCGELFPILLISLLLTGTADRALTGVALVAFTLIAVGCALTALRARPPRLVALLERSMHATSQLPVRACVLVLVALVYLAEDFGLDVVLGAFAAGMVIGLASRSQGGSAMLEHKLEAIGFGILIPIFFIMSGLTFDLDALTEGAALLQVPVFLLALLTVRGLPVLLHRNELAVRERLALALYSSTTLPLVVAITTIAVAGGHMRTQTAAALIAAGMLSVLLFPLTALRLGRRSAYGLPPAARVAVGA